MKKATTTLFCCVLLLQLTAQNFAPQLFNSMRWRNIGPFRGGRTVGAIGIPDQPNVFFIGVNNGGVWKTTDFGRTWKPLFDEQPTGSIGDIAIAASNPDIIYAGSGEGLQRPDLSVGDGIYKSIDGGRTWKNMGLKDGQQIGGLVVDNKNPDRVFVAVLGHPYGPNTERGVYRSLNGGQSWERVLYKDENTGAIQVTIDPNDPNTVYASLWAGRQGPWENGAWNGRESGLFKSTDGGTTWKKMGNGLPTTEQGLGRIGFCIAPSNSQRLYATVEAQAGKGGIYRTDDGGESWYLLTTDNRFYGRASDFAELKADPLNADIVYSANVVTWKSVDGGRNWTAFRGAPGGDDYHRIWINPKNPQIILLASDQGAIITVNGGETFSSWYNQSTAQLYHVSVDNAFPYNVYGGQQESGSVGISSRGRDGQISYREWHPVGVEEYGYVAADPLDPNIIYGGKITRFDKRTGQVQNIAPEALRSGKYRFLRTAPVLFSPVDPKTLYFAGNVVFKTRDGGNSWKEISPDLTRTTWDIPASVGVYNNDALKTMPQRGVVYTLAPSFKDSNTLWAGTDDGLIQVTRDGGKTWKDVTPPAVTSWSKISLMEASHTDVNTVYAAVNRIRCDDMRPHIYKTNDGGKTWKEIVNGLPNEPINAVREDPVRKGLLYAGSENAVYVSFDEGEHWQSLRLNMPATSIRDLVISKDDIVVGTHGRGFWILDDITPLRQLNNSLAAQPVVLYKPQQAWRVRWNLYTDTPVPQEEPAGENPPDGAIINYFLREDASSEVVMEITDANGKLVRRFGSNDQPYPIPALNIPLYWIRPQELLSAKAGSHRFVWDMHYTPFKENPVYPISAVYANTAPEPTSPWVMPGIYTIKLTVNGKVYTEKLEVKMDPSINVTKTVLQQQFDLSMLCYEGKKQAQTILTEIAAYRKKLQGDAAKTGLDQQLAALETTPRGANTNSLARVENNFASLLNLLQDADRPPTLQATNAVKTTVEQLKMLAEQWAGLKKSIQ